VTQHWATLHLAGHDIQVIIEENLQVDGDKAYGCYDENTLTITICAGLPTSLFWETLVHECIHAVMRLYTLTERLSSEEEEELFTAVLGTSLHQMLKPFIRSQGEG
jgi:hypothetical protein